MADVEQQFDSRESEKSTEKSYGVHTTHHPQGNAVVARPELASQTHTHERAHTHFILKDSLYSRLHSVILKARKAKRGEATATVSKEEEDGERGDWKLDPRTFDESFRERNPV